MNFDLLQIAPETAIKFMAYESMKRLIAGESQKDLGAAQRFIAGSSAGVISQTLIYPMEVGEICFNSTFLTLLK